jgi:RNA polymerase sigma-70 factor (ECF subfamily)
MVSSREDAADLLQDVGMVILEHQDPPVDAERFVSWCFGIARNVVLHHWRTGRRRDEIFTEVPAGHQRDVIAVPFERVIADRERLLASLDDLDEPSRKLLFLWFVDGKTSREIARELAQSPAAVRMRIMRVRKMLRDRLG